MHMPGKDFRKRTRHCPRKGMVINMDYVLQTNALTKHYGHFKALNGLTMNVPRGAIYGFVGKNGAGKTTLIRLICGLQKPTSGSYVLYGRQDTEKDIIKSRKRMGAVVETPSIYLDMSARDNMIQQYRILGLPSLDGLEDILKLVGLGDTGKRRQRTSPWACASGWASPLP